MLTMLLSEGALVQILINKIHMKDRQKVREEGKFQTEVPGQYFWLQNLILPSMLVWSFTGDDDRRSNWGPGTTVEDLDCHSNTHFGSHSVLALGGTLT